MKTGNIVKITKCTLKNAIGFTGKLYTNLACFHANANLFSIEILQIDKTKTCIGIINKTGVFWWTKHSKFDVEITVCN